MSLTTAALRQLVEFGLTAEQILSVAEAQGERVRSAGAERQARYRARRAESVTSDVTRDVTERHDEPTPFLEEIIPPSPPKGGSSPTGGSPAEPKPRKPRGSRFAPDDFQPTPEHFAKAAVRGLEPGDLERALSRFKNHEFPRAYTDWNRCFHNWLDRENPRHDAPSRQDRPSKSDHYADIFAALGAASGRTLEPGGGDRPPPRDEGRVRALPSAA